MAKSKYHKRRDTRYTSEEHDCGSHNHTDDDDSNYKVDNGQSNNDTTMMTTTINYQVKACRRQLITLPAAHLDVEQGGVEEGGDVLEEVKNS